MKYAFLLVVLWPFAVAGDPIPEPIPEPAWQRILSADVVIVGEVHDNRQHHLQQAELIRRIKPAGIVWEMLTPQQGAKITPELAENPTELAQILDWQNSGWPDFSLYEPVFTAWPSARMAGANVPRSRAREVLASGVAAVFGDNAREYGLADPLPPDEHSRREILQMQAHCDALPAELLPGMIDIQRLRDAVLARTVARLWDETGGPVVVITGNGHARADWGVPVYLARVRPDLSVFVLGQNEEGSALEGDFDLVLDAPPAEREDPCAAFR